jgi:ABC-type bacteriocin/lantibiotic exporter with double-glycine peptidase domain
MAVARISAMVVLLPVLASVLVLPVPFVAQEKDTCGAAALAMVLRYWERPASQDEIARELFDAELHGILGSKLAEFARRRGLWALAYEGDLAQLRDYLGKGRPLIVAWKLEKSRYHNVVVVGYDDEQDAIVVNDPGEGPLRRVPVRTFDERWAGSGRWTLLILPESR